MRVIDESTVGDSQCQDGVMLVLVEGKRHSSGPLFFPGVPNQKSKDEDIGTLKTQNPTTMKLLFFSTFKFPSILFYLTAAKAFKYIP